MIISYHIVSYHSLAWHIIAYVIICIPGSFRYVDKMSAFCYCCECEQKLCVPQGWESQPPQASMGTHYESCVIWDLLGPKFCSQPRSSLQPICALDPSRPRMLRTVTIPIVMETLATWSKMTQLWLRAKLKLTPKSGQKSCLDSCKDMAVHGMLPAQPGEKERKRGLQKRPHEHIMGTYQWLVGDWSR